MAGTADGFKAKADEFQRHHAAAGFAYGVIKKVGDDKGSQLAALITYYGFFSLFPLLLVAYGAVLFAIADACIRHGVAVAECLQRH